MIFKTQKQIWYTPDINGNLALNENSQLKVLIQRPTLSERGELIESISEINATGNNDKFNIKIKTDVRRILKNHVPKIENMSVEIDGKTVAITTGSELAELGVSEELKELCDLICSQVVKDQLTVEQKKR